MEGGKFWVTFKYERLPNFCFLCGKMGHDDKHCPETSDWHNTPRQYGDWLRENGKVGPDKSWSTSSRGRDENSRDRDAENAQKMARNSQASMTEGGDGSSRNDGKQTISDKGSMMGWEVTGTPMCQSAQKLDGWSNSIQIQMEHAPRQTTTSRANLDNSSNGPFGVMDKGKGVEYFILCGLTPTC